MKKSNSLLMLIMMAFIFSSLLIAQDVKDKLKDIQDPVDKITITSNGKEYTFEGEDAQNLFNKFKKSSTSSNSFVMKFDDDDETESKKVIVIKSDDDGSIFEFSDNGEEELIWIGEGEEDFNNLEKRIKIETEGGNKKVTVTTKEDGVEKTDVYEGKEADEFLNEMKSDSDNFYEFEIDDAAGKKVKKIKIEKKSTETTE